VSVCMRTCSHAACLWQDESGACTEFCAQIRSLWCRFLNAKIAKGSKGGLNAEGAKVTQRTQRRGRGLGTERDESVGGKVYFDPA